MSNSFNKDYPKEDGWYDVLVKWHEGCWIDEECDYEVLPMVMLNGGLYTEGIEVVSDGIDYDILGYSKRTDVRVST